MQTIGIGHRADGIFLPSLATVFLSLSLDHIG
jgi:hypothetical protein